MRIGIRDLAARDIDGVLAIEAVSFPTPWSRGLFEEEIWRDISDAIVAEEGGGGRLLGYAVCWTVAGESHLLNIAVSPDVRGRGVGAALLRECIRRGARAGSTRIYLEVRAGNDHAIRLYRNAGFEFAGIRRGYYTDTGEDAVVMQREVREDDAP